MKIAIYMTTVLNYGGGLEKYFIDTAASLSSQGIEVDLITMDERFTEKILKIISILFFKNHMKDIEARITDDYINKNIGKANYYKFQKISNLRKSLKKYDIVYSKNELLEAFILKYFICYGCIPKVVFCCATAINYPMPVTFIDKTHNALYSGSVYKSLCNGVAAYHVKNNDDKVRYSKMFPQKNIYYIPNAINNSFADFGALKPSKNKNILWVGRLTEQKGLDDLLTLVETLHQAKINWYIVGDGELKEKLLTFARKFRNIHYLGYVNNDSLPNVFSDIKPRLFLSTSHWETFGNNVLEAQAIGIPVVSYNITGPKEIIVDGKTGFLANDIDMMQTCIEKILNEPIQFIDIKKATINNFSRDIIDNKLIDMFHHEIRSVNR